MLSNELKEIIEKIKEQGKMHFIEAANDEQITLFENGQGFNLPSKYKEWLLFSDGGEFFLPAGIQMYGVAHKPVIDVSDVDKPGDKYIVIGSLASGDPILCEKDQETISIFNHEAGCIEDDERYDDFFAFLKGMYEFLGIGE